MCKTVPTYIYETCPECHPKSFKKTLAKFTGQAEVVETIEENSERSFSNEYLYMCCTCGAKMWVGESWVFEHIAKVGSSNEID